MAKSKNLLRGAGMLLTTVFLAFREKQQLTQLYRRIQEQPNRNRATSSALDIGDKESVGYADSLTHPVSVWLVRKIRFRSRDATIIIQRVALVIPKKYSLRFQLFAAGNPWSRKTTGRSPCSTRRQGTNRCRGTRRDAGVPRSKTYNRIHQSSRPR